jgi:hypothetical protein
MTCVTGSNRQKLLNLAVFSMILAKKSVTDVMSVRSWRYLRVGGRGLCLGAGREAALSQKNAPKSRRLPYVRCTLCWAHFRIMRSFQIVLLLLHML